MNKRTLAIRALAILVMVVFLRASARKLLGVEETALHFQAWGYPHWFMLLVASIELGGAALLPFARTRRVGAALLVPIMLGAIGTQVVHGAYGKAAAPTIVLMALVFLGTSKLTSKRASSDVETSLGSTPCNT